MTRKDAVSGRDRLLESAGRLFASAGFEGVSTKQLAAGAGLSIGALYHHFPTKEAAYCAALNWGLSRIPAMDPSGLSGEFRAQLEAHVAWFCAVIAASTVESQLLRLELLDPHLEARLSEIPPFCQSFERFQALLARLAPKADPELILAAIVSLGFGFSRLGGLRRQVPRFATRLRDPQEIARLVIQLIFTPEPLQ